MGGMEGGAGEFVVSAWPAIANGVSIQGEVVSSYDRAALDYLQAHQTAMSDEDSLRCCRCTELELLRTGQSKSGGPDEECTVLYGSGL